MNCQCCKTVVQTYRHACEVVCQDCHNVLTEFLKPAVAKIDEEKIAGGKMYFDTNVSTLIIEADKKDDAMKCMGFLYGHYDLFPKTGIDFDKYIIWPGDFYSDSIKKVRKGPYMICLRFGIDKNEDIVETDKK
ncbi:hypothetical protein F-VV57_0224 [Faustovirus]|nr:hypothetical protein F-VV57_0224 [Faustovirus]QJX73492.1 hypothetical protein F-VV63_0226 [Faustovirus]